MNKRLLWMRKWARAARYTVSSGKLVGSEACSGLTEHYKLSTTVLQLRHADMGAQPEDGVSEVKTV